MSQHKDIIQLLFYVVELTHFAHLNTTSYARHMALGSTYESLNSFKDQISEILIGKYGRIESISLGEITNMEAESIVEEISNFSSKLREHATEYKCYDLVNISDEVLALAQSLKYLITLV